MKFVWGKEACCLAAIVTLSLSGCGGGGGSSDNGSNAMVVDPYIKGAKFNEIEKETKKVLQTSEASKEDGKFKFGKTLTVGNTLEMKDDEKGEHGKVPFKGKLKYKVTKKSKRAIEEDLIIITPLTTLISDQIDELVLDGAYLDADAAEDAATEDVVDFVKTVTGVSTFTAADLAVDPMARVNDGEVTAADAALLAVNMAANTALEVLGDIDLTDTTSTASAEAVAGAVATELSTVFTANASNMTAATEAAVAVTTYISENKISDTTVISTVAAQAPAIITALEANPENVVVITDNGTPGSGLGTQEFESSNFAAQTYYDEGKAAFKVATTTDAVADYKLAASKFLAAAALKETITDSALKDKVLFFGAFATVIQLADPISDNTANGLNNFGDIIDAFGFAGSLAKTTDRSHLSDIEIETCTQTMYGYDCDLNLSSTSPTSNQLQTFAYNKVGAELQKAIAMLGAVSGSFSESFDDAGGIVEFDATDAKFISAVANGMLAQINFLQAYNLGNVDLDNEKVLGSNQTTERTADEFLAAYPDLGKVKDATRMAAFKTSVDNAIAALETTVTALQAEGDAQDNDFIKLSDTNCVWTGMTYSCTTTYNNTAEIAAFNADLAEVKTVMASTATSPYEVMEDTNDDGIDEVVANINLAPFFQGVNLRSKLPSTFNAGAFGDGIGPLDDWTFGGILQKIDLGDGKGLVTPNTTTLNTDDDKDGSPDLFDMTYFVPGMLKGGSFSSWIQNPGTNNWYSWEFTFDPTTNEFDCMVNGTPVSSGTYATNKNILTLNFSAPVGPNSVTRMVSAINSPYNVESTDFEFKTTVYNNTINLGTVYHYMWELY